MNYNPYIVQPSEINTVQDKSVMHFRRATPEYMSRIWSYLKMESGRTCDFSYGGFMMWVDVFDYKFCVIRDTLFTSGLVESDMSRPAFSLPVGELPLAESVDLLKRHCRVKRIPLIMSAVPEYAIEELIGLGASRVEELSGWGDYLYDAEMLSTLRGKKMAKKRNHVNQFIGRYGSDCFEPITEFNIGEAEAFLDSLDNEPVSSASAALERMMSRRLLATMKSFSTPLCGGMLRINGNIEALTVGDIKNDTLYIHVEKANKLIAGSYEMINKSFAEFMTVSNPDIRYINREDDAGDEGLRKAKESYHPIEILKKFNVEFAL